jgi:hypothetical protein
MAHSISRRGAILGSAALATIALVGGIAAVSADDTCRAVLTRLIGPFEMDRTAFASFVNDFRDEHGFLEGMLGRALGVGQVTGILPMTMGSLPLAVEDRVVRFERLLLTSFLFGTNYLQLDDPRTERIEYVGRINACGNPFAQFD